MIRAFQLGAFQLVAFQDDSTTIGGKYVEEEVVIPWRYREGLDSLYKHMAAVSLGRKGGISSGIRRRSR